VIPVFFDPKDFRFNAHKENFVLYVGRLIPRKGIGIACRAAEAAGVPLKIIGHGDQALITYGDYLGALDMAERNEWMSRASAVLCPTQYIEPFCCVAVEAMMCGTPVISTDFGGFVETVEHGKTGFRCSYLGEFVRAIHDCAKLTPAYIWNRAVCNYSMQAVAPQYEAYFRRLSLLWDGGWDTVESACKSRARMESPEYGQ
jgi:glycosyltransferase involved in cell wall biosynthesis